MEENMKNPTDEILENLAKALPEIIKEAIEDRKEYCPECELIVQCEMIGGCGFKHEWCPINQKSNR